MSEREWAFYLQDMINFANNVLLYKEDLNQAEFESTGLNYDATVRNLELIGEAATHIPEYTSGILKYSLAYDYCN